MLPAFLAGDQLKALQAKLDAEASALSRSEA
jgi:hypothetical protein